MKNVIYKLTVVSDKVHGCTNALKDRMSEKGHPEHSPLFAILGTVTLPTWM